MTVSDLTKILISGIACGFGVSFALSIFGYVLYNVFGIIKKS